MCMQQVTSIYFSSKPKRLIYEISSQTNEFGFEMAKTIPLSDGFGSIKYEINEFSCFFKNKNSYEEKFLASLLTAYDGDFEKRNIKSEDSEESLEGIGVNVLTFSDYSEFQGSTMAELQEYFKKGYLRRFIITFTESKGRIFTEFSLEEIEELNKEINLIGDELFEIFTQIIPNSEFVVSTEAYNSYQDYAKELCEYANTLDNDLLELEVNSRAYKALRLSAIYSALNHPKTLSITEEDMLQAISSVEFLSQEFKNFLNFKPEYQDVHDKILNFLKENLGKEFAKGYFTSHSRDFGVPREKMAKNFECFMETVSDIADNQGYILKISSNTRKNGYKYSLAKPEKLPLSNKVMDIDSVIDTVEHSKSSNSTEPLETTEDVNSPNLPNNIVSSDNEVIF